MKIKQLEWRGQINKQGQEEGLFRIAADVTFGNGSYYLIMFTITNFKGWNTEVVITPNIYYLSVKTGIFKEELFEFKTVEEAKLKAQDEYEKRIIELFFDQ